jgi:hypothetical protein
MPRLEVIMGARKRASLAHSPAPAQTQSDLASLTKEGAAHINNVEEPWPASRSGH